MASYWWLRLIVTGILCYKGIFAVFCSTRVLRIKNGDYSLWSGNSVAKFTCNQGFTLLGNQQIICFGSDWSGDPPICIANTCPKISESPTMRILERHGGAMLKFSCTVMHKLEGNDVLVCDGTRWNYDPPVCKAWDPPTTCDFEDPGLCGWSHHDEDDQEWRWNTGATKTTRTGPDHDHTFGDMGSGHYMYFETSSPTRTGHQAWLSSPLYPISYSGDYCFQFWYHSLGSGAMGVLQVFIKPELANLTDMSPVFYLNASVGDLWQRELVPIVKQKEPFKVFFVATRGRGYRSDFAIDDVNLQKCSDFATSPRTTLKTSTLPPTTPPPPTTKTLVTTKRSSAVISTTLKNTTPKPSTVKTSTSTSTTKPSTVMKSTSPTTRRKPSSAPTTRAAATTKGTTKKMPKPTTQSAKKTSVPATSTPKPSSQSVRTSTSSARKPTKWAKTTIYQSNPTTGDQQVTAKPADRGPNSARSSGGSDSSASKVAYIVVGIGICLCVMAAIGVGVYFYRRRRNKYVWSRDESFSADNPLYRVVASDDSAVQFGNIDDE